MAETLDLLCKGELIARGSFLLQGGQLYDMSGDRWNLICAWAPGSPDWLMSSGGQAQAADLSLFGSGESERERAENRSLRLTMIGDAGASLKRHSAQVRFCSDDGLLSLLTYEGGREFELNRERSHWHPLRHPERQFDRIYLLPFEQQSFAAVPFVASLGPRGRLSGLAERQLAVRPLSAAGLHD